MQVQQTTRENRSCANGTATASSATAVDRAPPAEAASVTEPSPSTLLATYGIQLVCSTKYASHWVWCRCLETKVGGRQIGIRAFFLILAKSRQPCTSLELHVVWLAPADRHVGLGEEILSFSFAKGPKVIPEQNNTWDISVRPFKERVPLSFS